MRLRATRLEPVFRAEDQTEDPRPNGPGDESWNGLRDDRPIIRKLSWGR